MTLLLYVLAAIAVGLFLRAALGGRHSHFQNLGESRLARELSARFRSPDYHLLNHITLSFEGWTTQIDHILISRFGVFVIETKNYSGWIFANARYETWTQVIYRVKSRFQNPIFQNRRHVRAVQALLDFLQAEAVRSAVVFVGDAVFKTGVPSGVYGPEEFIEHVRGCTEEAMTLNRMHFCIGRLEASRLAISGKTDVEHIESLERRYGRRF